MKDRNELIYRIRQIIGDEKEDGFYTSVKWNDKNIQVPNYLFKDGPAQYPEIRISPFLTESQASHSIRIREYDKDRKAKYYNTLFQIDIYATNIVLVNKIYDTVVRRIGLFYDIDTIAYGYNHSFQMIDKEKRIYYSKHYNIKDFSIISVNFGKRKLRKVNDKKELNRHIILTKLVYMFIQITQLKQLVFIQF